MSFWDYFGAVIIVGAVSLAAYYVTRLVGRAGGGALGKSANIKLLGSLTLARDRSVALVEIGGFAYVLGVSAQRVEKLDRLELDKIELKPEGPSRAEFSSDFKRQINEQMGKWLGHGGQNDIKNIR